MATKSSSRKPSPYAWLKSVEITRTKPHPRGYRPDLPLRSQLRQTNGMRVVMPRAMRRVTAAEMAATLRAWAALDSRTETP